MKIVDTIHDLLVKAERPLFFYDDDVDGVCSFLILHHFTGGKGKGVLVKSSSMLSDRYIDHVYEYQPDVVVVLDKAGIEEGFLSRCSVPLCWIDHHKPQEVSGVHYLNPHLTGDSIYPTSYWAWLVAEKKFVWLAELGIVSDWMVVDEVHSLFNEAYSDYATSLNIAPQVLFDSKIGSLVKLIMFNLKGPAPKVKKSLRYLAEINEISDFDSESEAAVFLRSRYNSVNEEYDFILKDVLAQVTDDKLLLYVYSEKQTSLTAYLSNELLFRYPEKVILIARHKGDEYKCSLRCSPPLDISKILEEILVSVQGYGGGHAQACGCCIKEDDWSRFVSLLKEGI